MSKAATSPTARLLQTSRLFSLPRPLPQPVQNNGAGPLRGSNTATTPYPTHQAITTTPAALHRGDYGLKRSLPAHKLRRTATPHVRINAQDTFEHITDFASAADHTQSERKWAEMGIPIMERTKRNLGPGSGPRTAPVSVYEAWLDNTVKPETEPMVQPKEKQSKKVQRWKYDGPYIAGMQDGEFNAWVENMVRRRKGEWSIFLHEKLLQTKLQKARAQQQDAQRKDMNEGRRGEVERTINDEDLIPTEKEVREYVKELRDSHSRGKLSSDLTALMAEFLDLPGIFHKSESAATVQTSGMETMLRTMGIENNAHAPPTTHPGAGLSFLRTNAVMSNHPLFGPQISAPPVEARVIVPRKPSGRQSNYTAKLGVGGFVADDSISGTSSSNKFDSAQSLDMEIEGGNKIWVQPIAAYVDERSRIRLEVQRAEPEVLAVKRGGEELDKIMQAKQIAQ